MLIQLQCTQTSIESMIQSPKSYDKEFKQMYTDARELSLYRVNTIILIVLLTGINILNLYRYISADGIRDLYDEHLTSSIIVLLQMVSCLYFMYVWLFTMEIHYVSTSSNAFANKFNIYISFWMMGIILLFYSDYTGNMINNVIIMVSGDHIFTVIRNFILYILCFIFIWCYIIYYNYGNKRVYEKTNILKFKKENGCISIYIYDIILGTDKLVTTIID